jgi:hypothetical protein
MATCPTVVGRVGGAPLVNERVTVAVAPDGVAANVVTTVAEEAPPVTVVAPPVATAAPPVTETVPPTLEAAAVEAVGGSSRGTAGT